MDVRMDEQDKTIMPLDTLHWAAVIFSLMEIRIRIKMIVFTAVK